MRTARLSLAVAVALVMSMAVAVASASATSYFDADVYPATVTGDQMSGPYPAGPGASHEWSLYGGGRSFECGQAGLLNTFFPADSPWIQFTATYSGCSFTNQLNQVYPAEIDMNSCKVDIEVRDGQSDEDVYDGDMYVECAEAGDGIEIKMFSAPGQATPICVHKISPQGPKGTVALTPRIDANGKSVVWADFNVTGLSYTVTGMFFCQGGSYTNGAYLGTSKLRSTYNSTGQATHFRIDEW